MTSSTDEMEQPAKQWQVKSVQEELERVNDKLDTILDVTKHYVTQGQLDAIAKDNRDYTDNKVTILEGKYGPIYKLFWALIVAIVVEAAVAVFILVSK